MSVARCQAEVDAAEFVAWREFWELEPFGEEWRQTAMVCLAMASAWMKKRGGGKWDVKDFMPGRGEPVEQTQEQIQRAIMGYFGFPMNGPR